jgi:hypothetical protein
MEHTAFTPTASSHKEQTALSPQKQVDINPGQCGFSPIRTLLFPSTERVAQGLGVDCAGSELFSVYPQPRQSGPQQSRGRQRPPSSCRVGSGGQLGRMANQRLVVLSLLTGTWMKDQSHNGSQGGTAKEVWGEIEKAAKWNWGISDLKISILTMKLFIGINSFHENPETQPFFFCFWGMV